MKAVIVFLFMCSIVFFMALAANQLGKFWEKHVVIKPCPEVSHD